jgi:predicted membrane protein
MIIGALIILSGVFLLLGMWLEIDMWAVCLPSALIVLGIWLLLRPWLIKAETGIRFVLLGDVRRRGEWQVADEEIWIGVGDVRLDMSRADVPPGETILRVIGLVGDVRVVIPAEMGLALNSTAFVADIRTPEGKRDAILTTFRWTTDDYEAAERRVSLEVIRFVGGIRIDYPQV